MSLGDVMHRRRVALSWLFAIPFFVLASPRPSSLIVGFAFMAAGAGVRTWASGFIRKQRELATAGPYAYSRNPLYFGSFLMAAGALIMGRNWWLVLAFCATAPPLYAMVMSREENFLEERFGEAFRNYRESVPRFLPRITPVGDGEGTFEWKLVMKHREWFVWAGSLVVTLLLLAKYYWL